MPQADFYNLMMFCLRAAGFELPSVAHYSPWRSEFWSPDIQKFLRLQLPAIAEQLIQRDLDIPEKIQTAIANPNLYNTGDRDLQNQCELFFPATCLRLALADCKYNVQLEAIMTRQERNAHRIIAQRESTQSIYIFTKSGEKVRRSCRLND